MKCNWIAVAAISLSVIALPAWAQTKSEQEPETNPQSSASTTVKQPAGVSTPATQGDTQGMNGAKTGCKSASAEMTNGAVETCKQ